jgi:hypothetical protein
LTLVGLYEILFMVCQRSNEVLVNLVGDCVELSKLGINFGQLLLPFPTHKGFLSGVRVESSDKDVFILLYRLQVLFIVLHLN